MQVLDDLYVETWRLFIAGSKFAKGDPRILKYIPTLEKMGEKAPVMKKLAERYTELTKEGQPGALADAGIFLYAVMATQCVTEVIGKDTESVSPICELPKTATPYSRLKQITDALTRSMQGRYEVIVSAFEEGLLSDFRIYGHLTAALDDKYSIIAEYIYKIVIPGIGSALIPYLLEQYDPMGKQGDAMRISLLGELGYDNAEELAFKAIEEGSLTVAASAIKILGKNPDNEKYLLTLANDKKSEIRESAMIALISLDSAEGKEHMMKLLLGSKYKSAIPAAKLCTDREYTVQLLDRLKPLFESLLVSELKDEDFKKINVKFTELLYTLDNKFHPDIYEFYIRILTDKVYTKRLSENKRFIYYENNAHKIVCELLHRSPDENIIKVCDEAMTIQVAKKHYDIIRRYYNASEKVRTEQQMYFIFAKYYEAGIISFRDMFCPKGLYSTEYRDNNSMEAEFKRARLKVNSQWKKIFIKKHDMYALRVLLCKGDELEKEMREAILKSIKEASEKKRADLMLGLATGRLIEILEPKTSLFKSDFEQVAEVCYEFFEKSDGYYFYDGMGKENFLKLFGSDYRERFKELAKKKTSNVFKEIEEVLSSGHEGK